MTIAVVPFVRGNIRSHTAIPSIALIALLSAVPLIVIIEGMMPEAVSKSFGIKLNVMKAKFRQ